jgi:hypothetical protein
MSIEVNRKLEYADRTAVQQADQTIKKDVVRALVELITNSDDSYRRLEQTGASASGDSPDLIKIFVQRRHENATICVLDWAEGMSAEKMDECVGTYAGETSGATQGFEVRGYFGRGLKEAILGLGSGTVSSICDDKFTQSTIQVENGVPLYKREKPVRATRALRGQFGIVAGRGSSVMVTVSRQGVRLPQIQNLRTRLERHYALREMIANPRRSLNLVELDQRGRVRNEYQLRYKFPVSESVATKSGEVPGYSGARFEIEVFRSEQPLEGPGIDRECADGGFIVKSPRAVLDLTLFKYEHDPAAERLFGKVTCAYLDKLLLEGEPLVKADRTGLDWSHDFARALKRAVETVLEPIIEEERNRARQSQHAAVSRKLQERINHALPELNKLATMELGKLPGDEDEPPFMPEGGFGFVPPYAQIVAGKQALLVLRASKTGPFKEGMIVQVSSDNEMVLLLTEHVVLEQDQHHDTILSAKIILEGRQVGAEAVITAAVDNAEGEAFVQVISKREPPEPSEKKKKGGLFHNVRFDEHADPRYRVRFDNGSIVVATSAPSVSPYVGPGGNGTENPQGQVMLAELVTEAVCKEIARQGIAKGKFIAPLGAETDALQREYVRLQNQYAAKIHALFVEPQYRNLAVPKKQGRPPKEEVLSRSTVPA